MQHSDIQGLDQGSLTEDSFHAGPAKKGTNGKQKPARFDTVLVDEDPDDELYDGTGIECMS